MVAFRFPVRMFRNSQFVFLVFLSLGGLADAEPWRSRLYPEDWKPPEQEEGLRFLDGEFIQDFSYAGYRMGETDLPVVTGPVFDVVEAFGADAGGETDATLAIQSAIHAAEANGGGVVYLPAGTFKISKPEGEDRCLYIQGSNVVLRGAGVDRTFLYNSTYEMRNSEIIRVRPPHWGRWTDEASASVLLVRDELGPSKSLKLASVARFAAGDWVVLHNPTTVEFVEELKMGAGSDGVDWTQQLVPLRGPRMLRQIVSVDQESQEIRLDVPTRWSLTVRDAARVYKAVPQLEEVGIEHLSIGNRSVPGEGWGESDYNQNSKAASHTHESFLIELVGVSNGWIRNVHSYNPGNENGVRILSNGIKLDWCRNVTLYQIRMSHAQYGGGGGNGYMIRLNAANECLISESEVGFSRHGIVFWRMENSGNVVSRCYDHDSGVQIGSGGIEPTSGRGSDHHGIFSHSNLFDSNRVERSYLEAAYRGDFGSNPDHGTTSSQTVYWNTVGEAFHSKVNYIVRSQQFGNGYVIGTSGAAANVWLTAARDGSETRTDPVDLLEGVGTGDRLYPQSLYLDQLRRRLGVDAVQLQLRASSEQGDRVGLRWSGTAGVTWVLEFSVDLVRWEQVEVLDLSAGIRIIDPTGEGGFYRLRAE